ncbi:hypothetical protein NC653_027381 [Populus alba x Populus x berolinensis]|uniref:Uncharacterized protein n=1 Tax=Populus alba x Populus x berolinensis TaxID=444605 RepID=A0AAD6Q631_9ROSI|nr:hypothetical protein NC653_027381 [Populus alba x Populus x berolinensis]
MSSATIPVVEETVFEALWPYKRQGEKQKFWGDRKRERRPRTSGENTWKQRGKPKKTEKKKPVKNNPEHKEEERKPEEQPLSSLLQKKNNPKISQNKSSRRWAQEQKGKQKEVYSRRKSPPAFQPELCHCL